MTHDQAKSSRDDDRSYDELYRLAEACFRDEITDDELQRLEEIVLNDPEARRRLAVYQCTSQDLRHWAQASEFDDGDVGFDEVLTALPPDDESLPKSWAFLQPIAAYVTQPTPLSISVALLVVGGFVASLALIYPEVLIGTKGGSRVTAMAEEVATLSELNRVVWNEDSNRPQGVRSRLKVGDRISLTSGAVLVRYDTGAKAVLEGPAEYRVTGKNDGFLRLGRLLATVETKTAHGFTVDTPPGRIIDLGTEFGVDVNASSDARIDVFEGRVEVETHSPSDISKQTRTQLAAGEALTINSGTQEIALIKADRTRFRTRKKQPSRVVTFDFSSGGRNSLFGENNTTYLAGGLHDVVSLTDETSGLNLIATLSSGTGNRLHNVGDGEGDMSVDIGIGDTQQTGDEAAASWGRGDEIHITFNKPIKLVSVYLGTGNSPRTVGVQPVVDAKPLETRSCRFPAGQHGPYNVKELVYDDSTILEAGRKLSLTYPLGGLPESKDRHGRITGIKVEVVDAKSAARPRGDEVRE